MAEAAEARRRDGHHPTRYTLCGEALAEARVAQDLARLATGIDSELGDQLRGLLLVGPFARAEGGIWERDGGVCQYTGRQLEPHEGNIDHVIPRSRGGKSTWDNCVLAHRDVNSRKGSRLPHEAGLTLRSCPGVPRLMPATRLIRNSHGVQDWERFLA